MRYLFENQTSTYLSNFQVFAQFVIPKLLICRTLNVLRNILFFLICSLSTSIYPYSY